MEITTVLFVLAYCWWHLDADQKERERAEAVMNRNARLRRTY